VPRRPLSREDALCILRETPKRLASLAEAASEAQLRAVPREGEWSANEVLAHLRSCADVWGSAMASILAEHTPTLRAINPTRWIESTDYRELEFRPSLAAFKRQRARLLRLLAPLPAADWGRGATVLGAGAPLHATLHAYAERLARHERAHWRQVRAAVEQTS
jgi:DinB superfamily